MSAPQSKPLHALTAAFALASSWTWLIGMFFPVLMIEDFGWPGWLVFFVPNAIGAASVGLYLSSARVAGFVRTHAVAVRLFTLVTVFFQGFVFAQLLGLSGIGDAWGVPPFALSAVGACVVLVALAAIVTRVRTLAGVAKWGLPVFLFSMIVLLVGHATGGTLTKPPSAGTIPMPAVLLALAGTSLGFLTCPFLDATLLRIREATPGRCGTLAFSLGYFGPFALLVGMTGLYAGGFLDRAALSHYVFAHMLVQAAYTAGFHAWAWRTLPCPLAGMTITRGARFPLGVLLIGGAAGLLWPLAHLRLGYEFLLSAYALPFPAYIWIVCVWAKRPGRRAMAVWAGAVCVAGPCFAIGYLGKEWAFVPLGVACVLVAPLILGRPGAGAGGGPESQQSAAV